MAKWENWLVLVRTWVNGARRIGKSVLWSEEMRRIIIVLLIVCLCASTLNAALVTYERITSNSEVDISGQLTLHVSSNGNVYDDVLGVTVNKVKFKFTNNAGGIDSAISEIYFYDGSLLNMYSIDDSFPGVDFEDLGESTNPAELPGYNPDYSLLAVLSATEAENPGSKKGVNVGQWIDIGYTLLPGKTFQDLLNDMATGEVVVGVHVKSIEQSGGGSAQSDSFITVPEPATICLLGIGGLLLRRRRG